jgi:hypothetical protein
MNTFHYGIHVDSESAVTGVMGLNNVPEGFFDETYDGINLTCEACHEHGTDSECDGCDAEGDLLIGAWRKDRDGLYEPDPAGEYSAILREDVVQIVQSIKTQRGALCSPCYPGQVDLDSPGEYLGYCLPW